MRQPHNRLSHAVRLERVVAYMAERLDQPPTLEQLAGVGHFSPWHFHRIYRAMMGETVAETLRRMRLHRAASELLHGTATLSTIARRCGYSATAPFNRAFAQAHGVPPGEYRRRGGLGASVLPVPTPRVAAPQRRGGGRRADGGGVPQRLAPAAAIAVAHGGVPATAPGTARTCPSRRPRARSGGLRLTDRVRRHAYPARPARPRMPSRSRSEPKPPPARPTPPVGATQVATH
jgi:AraC-like DNA-binding protein